MFGALARVCSTCTRLSYSVQDRSMGHINDSERLVSVHRVFSDCPCLNVAWATFSWTLFEVPKSTKWVSADFFLVRCQKLFLPEYVFFPNLNIPKISNLFENFFFLRKNIFRNLEIFENYFLKKSDLRKKMWHFFKKLFSEHIFLTARRSRAATAWPCNGISLHAILWTKRLKAPSALRGRF